MVEVLIILDGASERARADGRSSLEQAEMPALADLVSAGSLRQVRLLPDGVPVGSETAIAALLGWTPDGPVDRARVEAAARGIEPGPGERVWRLDVPSRRHRMLLVGPPPLPVIEAAELVRVWPDGAVPPRMLDATTVVIGARGAATGLGTLMGARVIIPPGATGCPNSDLASKRRAALGALAGAPDPATRVVVHVGGPDEASHRLNRAAKIAVLERADRELIGPLTKAVRALGGAIRVCADHGTDPDTGLHVGGPVPCVSWSASLVAA